MPPVTRNSHSSCHYRCSLSPGRTPAANALVADQPESTKGATQRENKRSHVTPPPSHHPVLGRHCRTRVPPPSTHALQSGCPAPSTFTTTPSNADKAPSTSECGGHKPLRSVGSPSCAPRRLRFRFRLRLCLLPCLCLCLPPFPSAPACASSSACASSPQPPQPPRSPSLPLPLPCPRLRLGSLSAPPSALPPPSLPPLDPRLGPRPCSAAALASAPTLASVSLCASLYAPPLCASLSASASAPAHSPSPSRLRHALPSPANDPCGSAPSRSQGHAPRPGQQWGCPVRWGGAATGTRASAQQV